jgi:glucosamine kinase
LGPDGATLGCGQAGPSGLGQGVEQAWRHVEQAIAAAFAAAAMSAVPRGRVALALGLAGAGVPQQRLAFLAADPGYAHCLLETDVQMLLAGAHEGRPGLVLIAGTGSVAAARLADGTLQQAGGWGFPVGDEGSGAWLGLGAVRIAQAVLDGRAAPGLLSASILEQLGPDVTSVLAWCARAGQHAYAQLAPRVFDAAECGDAAAEGLLQAAADALAALVAALQRPQAPLPIVVSGSVALRLAPRWPSALLAQAVPAGGDGADGALRLLAQKLARAGPRRTGERSGGHAGGRNGGNESVGPTG